MKIVLHLIRPFKSIIIFILLHLKILLNPWRHTHFITLKRYLMLACNIYVITISHDYEHNIELECAYLYSYTEK
jgi:hypothetical protein